MEELYGLYLEVYGKVMIDQVGGTNFSILISSTDLQKKLATALAITHAKKKTGLFCSKADFEKEIHKLSGSEG